MSHSESALKPDYMLSKEFCKPEIFAPLHQRPQNDVTEDLAQ